MRVLAKSWVWVSAYMVWTLTISQNSINLAKYFTVQSLVSKLASSDSLVDKLTSISDLNDLLVLDDKVCEPSTSSYRINLSNSLNNNYCNYCVVFLWYGEINK